MKRKTILAVALSSLFAVSMLAVPMSSVYAEGDDEEKKPESQLILSEGEDEGEKQADLIS